MQLSPSSLQRNMLKTQWKGERIPSEVSISKSKVHALPDSPLQISCAEPKQMEVSTGHGCLMQIKILDLLTKRPWQAYSGWSSNLFSASSWRVRKDVWQAGGLPYTGTEDRSQRLICSWSSLTESPPSDKWSAFTPIKFVPVLQKMGVRIHACKTYFIRSFCKPDATDISQLIQRFC